MGDKRCVRAPKIVDVQVFSPSGSRTSRQVQRDHRERHKPNSRVGDVAFQADVRSVYGEMLRISHS